MNLKNHLLSFVAVSALVAGGSLALADEKKGVEGHLEHYFPIRTALAGDKLDGVKDHAGALAKADDKAIAKAAKALADAKEVEAARKSFGELSKALLAEVQAAQKKGVKLPDIYVFECPMAKPYGKWLQGTKEIGNPYMGSKMPTCGKLVASMGAAPSEGKDHYTCPMCGGDESAPGKCKKCGMPLKKKP